MNQLFPISKDELGERVWERFGWAVEHLFGGEFPPLQLRMIYKPAPAGFKLGGRFGIHPDLGWCIWLYMDMLAGEIRALGCPLAPERPGWFRVIENYLYHEMMHAHLGSVFGIEWGTKHGANDHSYPEWRRECVRVMPLLGIPSKVWTIAKKDSKKRREFLTFFPGGPVRPISYYRE